MRPNPVGSPFILSVPFYPRLRIGPVPDGRGSANPVGMRKAFFLGVNLLGDMLCTTPVVRAYRRRNPDAFITYITHNAPYCRILDRNPDVDQVLYSERLYLDGERALADEAWLRTLPLDLDRPADIYRFNVHEVCRSVPDVFGSNIATAFATSVGVPIESVRPVVRTTPDERRLAQCYVGDRPYVVFAPHSTTRVIGDGGALVGKGWPADRWPRLAEAIHRTLGYDVIVVGAETEPALRWSCGRNLYGLPIKVVAALLGGAACVVTVESGLMHLGHAVDAAMVVIFSKYVPRAWSEPREASRVCILYDDPGVIPVAQVAAAVSGLVRRNGAQP